MEEKEEYKLDDMMSGKSFTPSGNDNDRKMLINFNMISLNYENLHEDYPMYLSASLSKVIRCLC